MKERKQSSTTHPMPFLLVSSTDHIAPVTGATPTVTISKDGGSFASPSGAVTEIGNGWYKLAGHATDRATLGTFLLHATATGADPADDRYDIVPWDPYDANLALTNLDAAVSSRSTSADIPSANITAIKAKTDNLPASPAAVSDIPTAAQNADKLLGRTLAGAADGGRTVKDALRVSRNKVTIVGTTFTCYQEDDTTVAWTGTLTTDATANPITAVDPA